MGKNKAKNTGDFRFMIGVRDTRGEHNLFYAKNLDLLGLENVFKEMKKKYK